MKKDGTPLKESFATHVSHTKYELLTCPDENYVILTNHKNVIKERR